jgi:hypothetical protein
VTEQGAAFPERWSGTVATGASLPRAARRLALRARPPPSGKTRLTRAPTQSRDGHAGGAGLRLRLDALTGLSVRTLRYYADAGVIPETGRNQSGYRLLDAEAVDRARLVRSPPRACAYADVGIDRCLLS